jgi:antitoxin HicB
VSRFYSWRIAEKEATAHFITGLLGPRSRFETGITNRHFDRHAEAAWINAQGFEVGDAMRNFQYPATLKREKDGGFTVQFTDIPEAITSGVDRREALMQAADCLEEAIAARISDGLEIPNPKTTRRNQVLVTVPAPVAAKAALYVGMRETKMSNSELARRLRCDEKEVRRMLDPRHPTKLPRIQKALQAIGKRLIVSMEEEAA